MRRGNGCHVIETEATDHHRSVVHSQEIYAKDIKTGSGVKKRNAKH